MATSPLVATGATKLLCGLVVADDMAPKKPRIAALCQTLSRTGIPRGYFAGVGANSFSSFAIALSRRFWRFSGLLFDLIVSLAEPRQTSDLLARTCIAHQCRGVFVDLTGLGGPIDPVDRVLLAARLAEVWPPGVRLAALALPHQVKRVIEHMAGNCGIDIRAFTEREEAFAWLALTPARAG